MAQASRDQNNIPTLLGVSSSDGTTPVTIYADPSTHRLLVNNTGLVGDVVGPASATDNAVARFDGTTGKLIQNSVVTIGDTGNVLGVGTFSSGAITSTGASSLGSLAVTSTANPGFQIGDGSNGYIKIGDATLSKTVGNFFSFLDNGIQGTRNLVLGQDSPNISVTLLAVQKLGTSEILAMFRGQAGQTGDLLQFQNDSSVVLTEFTSDGRLGIGTTSPNANAMLDVVSTTKAFMPPRMTGTQRDNIPSPTAGMVIYNSSTAKLNVYTTAWEEFANSALSNLASVAINTSLLPGTDDGAALGSVTKEFSDLFLASGGVINWANGNIIITQTSDSLTISGGVTNTASLAITTVAGQNAELWMSQATGSSFKIKAQDTQVRITSTTTILFDSDDVGTNTFTIASTSITSPNLLISGGARTYKYTAFTSGPQTLDATNHVVNCTTGTFTVTLPTAVSVAGRVYTIKNSGTGVITVGTTSSQTIDGFTTFVLSAQYSSVTVVSNGANWIIV